MTYKDKYTHIKKETINIIRILIKTFHYYKFDDKHKFYALRYALFKLNEIYKTDTKLKRMNNVMRLLLANGYYNHLNKTIYLNKLSLVTFLHEFKHSLQHQKGKKNSENIARGWSVSLFALASPYHYERAKRKGLLFFD